MTTSPARSRRPVLTAFWDTSAVVPLCCLQPQSAHARRTARMYARQVAWWGTPVEAVSAFNRLVREKVLTTEGRRQALARLDHLRQRWYEVQPLNDLRAEAERMLALHTLRAGDALQLAAALIWCERMPRGRVFVGSDDALAAAADAEGFTVIRLL